MRLCFVVDYRSPIARNWIDHFVAEGYEVHVISTFPTPDVPPTLASYQEFTIGMTGLTANPGVRRLLSINGAGGERADPTRSDDAPVRPTSEPQSGEAGGWRASLRQRAHALATDLLFWVTPFEARARAGAMRSMLRRIRPDLVHAMRIPCEGMLAAEALAGESTPLVTSVWGNDFTLWAARNPVIAAATRRALRRTTALHTDCYRDRHLAEHYGWDPSRTSAVLPGSGGVQMTLFHRGAGDPLLRDRWRLPAGRPIVVNPRAFRPSYVRNDVFFAAVPRVLAVLPDALFAGVAMQDNPLARRWCAEFGIADAVRLLPRMPRADMAELFRLATVSVSPSLHDGTPNTLLESMACGAFPVAGDIESVREWITDGENGLLCDPTDADALANAMIRALRDDALRADAARRNRRLIEERADYDVVMREAGRFYEAIVAGRSHRSEDRPERRPDTHSRTPVTAADRPGS